MSKSLKQLLAAVLVMAVMFGVLPSMGQVSAKAADTTYVKVNAKDVHLRPSPGTSDYVEVLEMGTVCQVKETLTYKKETWYNLIVPKSDKVKKQLTGYINSKYMAVMTPEEVAAWQAGTAPTVSAPTATPTPAQSAGSAAVSQGKIANSASVNFRKSPEVRDDNIITSINRGEVVELLEIPSVIDNNHWYKARYNNAEGYIMATYVAVTSGSTATNPPAASVGSNGAITTKKVNVNLRLTAGGSGDTILQIPKKGTELEVKAPIVEKAGYKWYYVEYSGVRGYVRSDVVTYKAPASGAVTAAPSATATPAPVIATSGYVKTIKPRVNIRKTPMGSSIIQLDKNVTMPVVGIMVSKGGYKWYPVRIASGTMGYVRSDCVKECDSAGGTSGGSTIPSVTAAPAETVTGQYIKTTKAGVKIRNAPAGQTLVLVEKGTEMPLASLTMTTAGGYKWYHVSSPKNGYVRSDCATIVTQTAATTPPTGTTTVPTATPAPSLPDVPIVKCVKSLSTGLNLRAAPTKDSKSMFKVGLGQVMSYTETQKVGSVVWYHVNYNNNMLWAMGDFLHEMTDDEYRQYIAQNPTSSVIKGYVKTTSGGVNVRTKANGGTIIGRLDKGTVVPYTAEPISAGGYKWYYVATSYGNGYIRSDFAKVTDQSGAAAPTTAPTSSPTAGGTEYVKYSTLRLGSKGEDVKKMVTKLKELGYYTGTVTDTYTSDVQASVKSFQAAKGLKVDGLAGQNTLSALYGTSATQGGASSSGYTFYPAEKIDWETGGIQKLWPKGASFRIYDVYTGKTWVARRWSGGLHCDAEPLTADDTATLCEIYGVKKASQITSSTHWQRRPLLITIGTRTFAASMYGVPHNYPDGDTIANNNFDGQLCIHFTNSKIHRTGVVDTEHQKAIDYAWNHCPAGKK